MKPDGEIVLLRHVRIDRPLIGRLMDVLDPLLFHVNGSHVNRRTVEADTPKAIASLPAVERIPLGGFHRAFTLP